MAELPPTLTIRQRVRLAQVEIRDTELSPQRARNLLNELSAIIGNCNDEIRVADLEYAEVLLTHLEAGGAANRARIKAETTPQYQRKREAIDTKDLVIELCRALKYFLRSLEEEMKLAN